MDPALQKRVQRYGWDKAAAFYESHWQQQLLPAQEKLLELAAIRPGEKIIDIACGTGLVSFKAAALTGNDGFVLGNDISDKMVEISNTLAKERNLSNIRFERMDAEELTVEDGGYDVALCALGLMYVTDYLKALKEMYRVLNKTGRVVAAVWGERDRCGWSAVFEIVDKRVSSDVCPMFFNLGNANMLRQYFKAAGFMNMVEERINTTLIYKSDEEACGAAFIGGPVALAYNKFPEQVKREAEQEYIDSIARYKKEDTYYIPGEFVVVAGYK